MKTFILFDISNFAYFYQFKEFYENKLINKLPLGLMTFSDYSNRKEAHRVLPLTKSHKKLAKFIRSIRPVEAPLGEHRAFEQVFYELNFYELVPDWCRVILISDGRRHEPRFTNVSFTKELSLLKQRTKLYVINTGDSCRPFLEKISNRYYNVNNAKDAIYLLMNLMKTKPQYIPFMPDFPKFKYEKLELKTKRRVAALNKVFPKRIFTEMQENNFPSKDILIVDENYTSIIDKDQAKLIFRENLDREKYKVYIERSKNREVVGDIILEI